MNKTRLALVLLFALLASAARADLVCPSNNMCCQAAASTGAGLTANTFTGDQTLGPDVNLDVGGTTTAFGSMEWSTVQTPDTWMIYTGSTSNHVILAERGDAAYDNAIAAKTDPTYIAKSHNQATTEWIGMSHNGTNGQISTGAGGLNLDLLAGGGGAGGNPGITWTNRLLYFGDLALPVEGVRIEVGTPGNPSSKGTIRGATSNGIASSSGGEFWLAGGLGHATNPVPARLVLGTDAISAGGTTLARITIGASKILTNNTVTALTNVTLASNTVAAGSLHYACEVFDATDLQIEEGEIAYHVTNKGGVIANNAALKYGNQQAMTSGTLTVTWTITAASPAVLSVNCNSSLTPSAGYPRVTYELHNLTQQAVAIQ